MVFILYACGTGCMYSERKSKSLMLSLLMLVTAISPIVSTVSADHGGDESGNGTYSGMEMELTSTMNGTNDTTYHHYCFDEDDEHCAVFMDEGEYEFNINSYNLNINDSYNLEFEIIGHGIMDGFYDQEESRNWTAYYDSSSENFSIDIDNFTCEIIIFAGITNINTTEYMNMEWVVLGPCGNNGILGVEIEIFGAWMDVPSFHSEDLWDDMIHLDEGTYNMSWTKPSGYFTSGNDYLIEYMREVESDLSLIHI